MTVRQPDVDDLSPEQRIVVEVLRMTGDPHPEATVRADRLTAYWIGAQLAPALRDMATVLAEIAELLP